MTMKMPVYLDNHATTRVDPRVVEAMLPFFTEQYGNASSKQHEFGWFAEAAVEAARSQIAELIGARDQEIVFTSGATESINLAIKGVAECYSSKGNHIITVSTEHKAVLDTCHRLEASGFRVTYLAVDRNGCVDPEEMERAITDKTILVSVMAANNEIGTLAPVEEISKICASHGVLFHTDATQAAGKITIDLQRWQVDLMSLSSHKMYGPKGIGALVIRAAKPRIRLAPQMDGGGHEHGVRSGTLNVPGIVGFGMAARIAQLELQTEAVRTRALRDKLVAGLRAQLEDITVNGHPEFRLPNNANITIPGVKADRLMMDMKDVAISSGSACSSSSPEPSHVLLALGLSKEEVLSSIRLGVGRFTTEEEINYAIRRIAETARKRESVSMKV